MHLVELHWFHALTLHWRAFKNNNGWFNHFYRFLFIPHFSSSWIGSTVSKYFSKICKKFLLLNYLWEHCTQGVISVFHTPSNRTHGHITLPVFLHLPSVYCHLCLHLTLPLRTAASSTLQFQVEKRSITVTIVCFVIPWGNKHNTMKRIQNWP